MSTPLWIASFLYLALLSSWVFAAIRDDEREPGQAGRQSLSLFAMITGGTLIFVGLILLIGLL
jgi:hypothetical protein